MFHVKEVNVVDTLEQTRDLIVRDLKITPLDVRIFPTSDGPYLMFKMIVYFKSLGRDSEVFPCGDREEANQAPPRHYGDACHARGVVVPAIKASIPC